MLRVKGRARTHGQIDDCRQKVPKGTLVARKDWERDMAQSGWACSSSLISSFTVMSPGQALPYICDAQLCQLQLRLYQCGQGVEVGNTGLEWQHDALPSDCTAHGI